MTRDYCIVRRKAEAPAFVRVLKAMPQDKLDYRPDPKARTARELAGVIVSEEKALLSLLDTGTIDWKDEPPAATVAELVADFERHSAQVNERLERLDDAGWQKQGRFLMSGGAWEQPVSEFVWLFLFDAVHHRGQLSTYLRPMGGKVPSIYGPSADDPGGGA
jgi:uncharacterized damage-inducible protein DinB